MSYVLQPSPKFNTGQLVVSTSAIPLLSENKQRGSVIFSLVSANNLFIGNSNVSLLNGFLVSGIGNTIEIHTTAAIYGIAPKTTTISYLEETW